MKIVVCERTCRIQRMLQNTSRGIAVFPLREAPQVCDIVVAAEDYFPASCQRFPRAALFVGGQEVFRRMAKESGEPLPFESLVFCGMNCRDTLVFSSFSDEKGLLCLQRSVVFRKKELSIGEYPVFCDGDANLYENLICSFIRLCQGMCESEKVLQRG